MGRPSFQFYPGDWQRNANLRRCSPAARGVWVDIMCLLHDSDEYGVLRWPLADIAQAAGAQLSLVKELVQKQVFKGVDQGDCPELVYTPRHGRKDGEPVTLVKVQPGPVWYSSRMVRDEYIRTIRGESSRFGEASGETPKSAPKPPFGDGSSNSSSSATSVKKPKLAQAPFVLPDWVPKEPWEAFIEMRRSARKSPTERAKELLVKELEKLREQGHEPTAVIEQSTRKNWLDFFPIKKADVQQQSENRWWESDNLILAEAAKYRIGTSGKTTQQLVAQIRSVKASQGVSA